MTAATDLSEFARRFRSDITDRAFGLSSSVGRQEDISGEFKESIFVERLIDILSEAGAIDDGHVCHFEKHLGSAVARASGYSVNESEDRLDLLVAVYHDSAEADAVAKDAVVRAAQQGFRFIEWALQGGHEKMEPASEAHSMAQRIHEIRATLDQVNLFIVTDGLARTASRGKGIKIAGPSKLKRTIHVWDLERIYHCVASGSARESIEVDFIKDFGSPLPCLPAHMGQQYGAYLAVMSGEVLHRLYDDYGERLLELNVRSFLQARGKVNKGIRDTILKEPERFFAYNNGITAIAEEIKTVASSGGGVAISWVRGLQIVNGGQTTASLHRAAKRDHADLRSVAVQAKISVVKSDLIDEIVPSISLYANSQNKVNEADFSANHPYHLKLEELSRTLWAPGGQTRWFYERARGQYQVAKARALTPARIRQFEESHPQSQLFTKTDLATFVNSWSQLPHTVSRGAQKNFREFTLDMKDRAPSPDEEYFGQMIAKAVIFRAVQAAARRAAIGAYRANIVTYTVAYISRHAGEFLDLAKVWKDQRAPAALETLAFELFGPVEEAIKNSAGIRNVTEWCKKEDCWKAVEALHIALPPELAGGAQRESRRRATAGVL